MSVLPTVRQVVGVHCKQCNKGRHPRDVLYGLCVDCWQARIQAHTKSFRPEEFYQNEKYRCYECKAPFLSMAVGYLSWDVTANSFCLLCVPCGKKKHQKDALYRGTEFSYTKAKAQ